MKQNKLTKGKATNEEKKARAVMTIEKKIGKKTADQFLVSWNKLKKPVKGNHLYTIYIVISQGQKIVWRMGKWDTILGITLALHKKINSV